MKFSRYLIFQLLFISLAFGQNINPEDNLAHSSIPKKYFKRNEPVLNIVLVYYGDTFKQDYLDNIEPLLKERFYEATNKMLRLNVLVKEVLPYLHNIKNYPTYSQTYVTELERLQRLWYYDNVNHQVGEEVYQQCLNNPNINPHLKNADTLVIITGAQFEALGFASGRIAVTENPREIAWTLASGYTNLVNDYQVVDELIHEIGHTLYLDHTSNQCQKEGLTIEEKTECCLKSPSKNDVMSYCRDRRGANEEFYFKFEACNLGILKNIVIPSLLQGGNWAINQPVVCP